MRRAEGQARGGIGTFDEKSVVLLREKYMRIRWAGERRKIFLQETTCEGRSELGPEKHRRV